MQTFRRDDTVAAKSNAQWKKADEDDSDDLERHEFYAVVKPIGNDQYEWNGEVVEAGEHSTPLNDTVAGGIYLHSHPTPWRGNRRLSPMDIWLGMCAHQSAMVVVCDVTDTTHSLVDVTFPEKLEIPESEEVKPVGEMTEEELNKASGALADQAEDAFWKAKKEVADEGEGCDKGKEAQEKVLADRGAKVVNRTGLPHGDSK